MNINFDDYIVPIIVVGCLCVGYVLKNWMPTDNKIIPTVLLVLGGILGAILFGPNVDGIVMGAFSGLVSVGAHQIYHQWRKSKFTDELTEAEAFAAFEENDELIEELEEFNDDEEEEDGEEV